MNYFNANKYKLILLISFAFLLLSAATIQKKYDNIVHPNILFKTETRYILPTSVVLNFSFGFNNIMADLYWVRAIQDFAIWDGTDPFYLQEYKNIAALDPKFSYPYLLGILTFTSRSVNDVNGNISTLDTIEPTIKIGIENLPDNWEIPFYMGTGFQLAKNPEKALYYLKIAATNPKAPEIVPSVYKSYLRNTLTGEAASRALVKTIYETTESETTKKILEKNVIINDLVEVLQNVVNTHKSKYGYYPSSIDDLVARKLIQSSVELKSDFNISINRYTGEVKVVAKGVE
ncbi:MAG: hypothetical protein K9L31_01460 [Candidatus Pacebacteria bacterium]|nr:hypothetical protein [Candidatus Paceibacterota bacterium]